MMIIHKDLILKNLNEKNLFLHGIDKDTIQDARRSYRETTGNVAFGLPCDEFFVVNECGNVVHIGNLHTLQSFALNYEAK